MVTRENQGMQLRLETEESQAHDRTVDEIERRGSFLLFGIFQGSRALRCGHGRQIVERHGKFGRRRKMKGIMLWNNSRAQTFVAVDEILKGCAQCSGIKLSLHE